MSKHLKPNNNSNQISAPQSARNQFPFKNPTYTTSYSKPHNLSFRQFHYIDCIYSGYINNSHYKQGFGILQTFQFHTYFGYFKNNKAQGLGLAILNNGTKIYGNWIKDQLNGLALIDDGKGIKLGIWEKIWLNGIGYHYDYDKYMWRMVKYVRNNIASILKEQVSNLQGKMPKILNMQHSIYMFLNNYLNYNFFPETKSTYHQSTYIQSDTHKYIHRINQTTLFLGLKNNGQYHSLGLKYDKSDKSVIQTGYYQNGALNGFGMKYNPNIKYKQIGIYVDDQKQGIFMHQDHEKIMYAQYYHDTFMEDIYLNGVQYIRKKQKQYNYHKKSFNSQKNTLDLHTYDYMVRSNLRQHTHKYMPVQKNNTKQDLNKILQAKRQMKQLKQKQNPRNTKMLNILETPKDRYNDERFSYHLIKQKIRNYDIFDPEYCQMKYKQTQKNNDYSNLIKSKSKDKISRSNSRSSIKYQRSSSPSPQKVKIPVIVKKYPQAQFDELPIEEQQNPFKYQPPKGNLFAASPGKKKWRQKHRPKENFFRKEY